MFAIAAVLYLADIPQPHHLDRRAVQRLQALPRQQAVAIIGVLRLTRLQLRLQLREGV